MCLSCSEDYCPIGQYRGACLDSSDDAVCLPCTGNPANSHFTAAGSPTNVNNCSWMCNQNYYQTVQLCSPCSAGQCPLGTYLLKCSNFSNNQCLSCIGNPPFSSFSALATSANCTWSCYTGYTLSSNGLSCVTSKEASIRVTFQATLQLSKQTFLLQEDNFISSVAITAGVTYRDVIINSIVEVIQDSRSSATSAHSRKLMSTSVLVNTSVNTFLRNVNAIHNQEAMNNYLTQAGLPACSLNFPATGQSCTSLSEAYSVSVF